MTGLRAADPVVVDRIEDRDDRFILLALDDGGVQELTFAQASRLIESLMAATGRRKVACKPDPAAAERASVRDAWRPDGPDLDRFIKTADRLRRRAGGAWETGRAFAGLLLDAEGAEPLRIALEKGGDGAPWAWIDRRAPWLARLVGTNAWKRGAFLNGVRVGISS